jgi:putative acyl-CoA dehydrogenase
MSDAFLTLAYGEGGLTCFLVPRWRPDGERNAIEIQRLKDKLGDRSNASSEIEYRGAWARRVGDEGRGVRTIIEMVQLTRLDCVIGAATQHRSAFQRRLVDQPLMRAVLADMAVEVEAAVALAFRLAKALDAAADPREAALARIGLPIAKYLVTKRAPAVVAEAMECLGGAGYVEESPLPRLFRQSPLNAIWEGSGNVIALDLLRALQREPEAREALLDEIRGGPAADEAERLLCAPVAEGAARHVIERLGVALAAATLARFAPTAVADAYATRRVHNASLTLGAGEGAIDEDGLLQRLALSI